jgi:hypothetical protein
MFPEEAVDPSQLFFDERWSHLCAYCGQPPSTSDHIPSKVMLDKPYPAGLRVIQSCLRCNNELSKDEEFLACLISCAKSGSTEIEKQERESIRATLRHKPHILETISRNLPISHQCDARERIENAFKQFARGHYAFECAELLLDEPVEITFFVLEDLSHDSRLDFETIRSNQILPEIGSRMFLEAFVSSASTVSHVNGWIVPQENRYRYAIELDRRVTIKIVLNEYLAAQICWPL